MDTSIQGELFTGRYRPEQRPALPTQSEARDHVLAVLAEKRATAIRLATEIAVELCARDGWTSSVRVRREMEARHPEETRAAGDPRWLGAVLLPTRGFARTGETDNAGHHARPVARWRLRGAP